MVVSELRAVLRRSTWFRRAVVSARFGDLRRITPLTEWGTPRGLPVDRWYIDRFLDLHRAAVTGRVLEVKSDVYASRLGAAEVEVLDIDPANRAATVVGDLCDPATLAARSYDTAIVTQTLQLVPDPAAALENLLRSLRPGGTLLLTVPCLSRICDGSDRWRWAPTGFADLLAGVVGPGADVVVEGLGNSLAARAFLFGLAAEDLDPASLDVLDPDYPLVVGAAVVAPG